VHILWDEETRVALPLVLESVEDGFTAVQVPGIKWFCVYV
jgi:hypothetical protein